MNKIGKRRVWPTERPKRIIIMIKRRKSLCPIGILKIIRPTNFLIRISKGIREKNINWSTFKKYFNFFLLSEQYYEERAKEFYELKLGTMTMKRFEQ